MNPGLLLYVLRSSRSSLYDCGASLYADGGSFSDLVLLLCRFESFLSADCTVWLVDVLLPFLSLLLVVSLWFLELLRLLPLRALDESLSRLGRSFFRLTSLSDLLLSDGPLLGSSLET